MAGATSDRTGNCLDIKPAGILRVSDGTFSVRPAQVKFR